MQNRKKLYDRDCSIPFKLSRSKIELYVECPRCFFLDRRHGIGRPPGFPFNLNSAVDALLKKEFDSYRAIGCPHPLMVEHGLHTVPFAHEQLDDWRMNQRGIRHLHEPTRFLVYGAVDDVWINQNGQLMVVDYKATSKSTGVSLDADWQQGYKRQMEVYQWLLRKNDFEVSSTGYFVYCNGKRDPERFDACLKFDISLIPYHGQTDWIEPTLLQIKACLEQDEWPEAGHDCAYCRYGDAINDEQKRTE